ncbi:DUF4185 domain-containing protein [Mucilaginibacter sp. Bleaf8]|uniref:DUF4185 domain-containing protein n=1 Tax=Mucilaginibacter sp. Bleaf8 TaxID=2834430 RepID=UPI001BCFF687|nr:DUF4185 domain-containing protein [Mucilaginibacter sp. Bleaf8]MBS7564739.1 DUF4185 domain-containing protein [Mucilaginibacter sp. Bleaf8]
MAILIKRAALIAWASIGIICLSPPVLKAQTSKTADLTYINFTVERAPDWSDLFRRYEGWFGGDGIYTIPLNGREHVTAGNQQQTLFIFSDSMVGQVTDSVMLPGYKMIHNSVAYLTGNKPLASKMKFYWNLDKHKAPEPVFTPRTPKTVSGDYYWLGDGFVNTEMNNAIYIFGYRVHNVSNEAFGFREVGNTLIKIAANERAPFAGYKEMDTPFYLDNNGEIGSFGAGVYINTVKAGAPAPDGYIYVYGVKGMAKQLLVARVKPADFERFAKWKFWDGRNWVADMHKAVVLTDSVSNELSVTALPDGRYALIFQEGGMGKYVAMRIGASPAGPFGPIIRIWDCSNDLQQKTHVVYNAKAHPSLSAPGELLISYNINSVEFIKDLNKDPHLYRPRFIRLRIK